MLSQEIFLASGNGGFQYCPNCVHYCAGSPTNYVQRITDMGEAMMGIKMQNVWSTTSGQAPFWPTDYFVPDAVPPGVGSGAGYFEILNYHDWDLGVTGTLLFDDTYYESGTGPISDVSMLLAASKRGDGYVLQQNYLGQITNTDQYIVNHFLLSQGAAVGGSNPMCTGTSDGMECDEPRTPAYWRPYDTSTMGFLPSEPGPDHQNKNLASFQWQQIGGSQYNFTAVPPQTNNVFSGPPGYPGGTLALTFNPNPLEETSGNAVVWAVVTSPTNDLGYLLAYSLTPAGVLSSNPIWPTSLPLLTPQFAVAPYAIPTAVNGKVYVPTYGMANGVGGYTNSGIAVYGLP